MSSQLWEGFMASLERVIVVLSYVQPLGPSVLLGLLLLTRCVVAEQLSQVLVSLVKTKWSLEMCWYLYSIFSCVRYVIY